MKQTKPTREELERRIDNIEKWMWTIGGILSVLVIDLIILSIR